MSTTLRTSLTTDSPDDASKTTPPLRPHRTRLVSACTSISIIHLREKGKVRIIEKTIGKKF